MPNHDIIVVGASAGGVEALRTLVAGLPAGLPASVFVVLHMSPDGPGLLPVLLARAAALPVEEARDGASFQRGHVYLARPDHHLVLEKGLTRVIRGLKENRARPAVDPLFRSAALEYGPRVIGVVLTGALNDGAAGLAAIKKAGGLAVVQDPEEALFDSMPRSALQVVAADHVVRVADLGALLARLVLQPAAERAPAAVPARRASRSST